MAPAVPRDPGGDRQHAADRRDDRPAHVRSASCAAELPGARRSHRRELAARRVPARPRASATGRSPTSSSDRLDYELDVIIRMGYAGLLPDRGRLHPLRPRAGHRDHLPRLGAGLDRDLHAGHHAGRPDPLRAALRALPEPRPGDDARHRRRLRGQPPRRGHRLRHAQVRLRPRGPDHHLRHDARPGRHPRRRPGPGHGLRRGRPHRQGRPQPARHQARRGARDRAAAARDGYESDPQVTQAHRPRASSSRAWPATPRPMPPAWSSAASR